LFPKKTEIKFFWREKGRCAQLMPPEFSYFRSPTVEAELARRIEITGSKMVDTINSIAQYERNRENSYMHPARSAMLKEHSLGNDDCTWSDRVQKQNKAPKKAIKKNNKAKRAPTITIDIHDIQPSRIPLVTPKSIFQFLTTKPNWIPDFPPNISPIEQLNLECTNFVEILLPTKRDTLIRTTIYKNIKNWIESYDEKFNVQLYGSTYHGLYLPNSNIDVIICSLDTDQYYARDLSIQYLSKLAKLGSTMNKTKRISKKYDYSQSMVPVLKLECEQSLIPITIRVHSHGSSLNSGNVAMRLRAQLPGFDQVYLLVKQFLNNRGLDSDLTNGVGGYGLLLWVGAFLRIHDSIYTDEQVHKKRKIVEDKSVSGNILASLDLTRDIVVEDNSLKKESIGLLFLHFLHFFGFCFDYDRIGLAPGGCANDPNQVLISRLEKSDSLQGKCLLYIVDPVENIIVTGNSFNISVIVQAFRQAYEVLLNSISNGNNHSNGFLGDIMHMSPFQDMGDVRDIISGRRTFDLLSLKRPKKKRNKDSGKDGEIIPINIMDEEEYREVISKIYTGLTDPEEINELIKFILNYIRKRKTFLDIEKQVLLGAREFKYQIQFKSNFKKLREDKNVELNIYLAQGLIDKNQLKFLIKQFNATRNDETNAWINANWKKAQ
jgi:hypothetical protein